jgi:hypothetical protein
MDCVTMKVYTLGVGHACGECDSVSDGRNWILVGNPFGRLVQLHVVLS